MSTLSKNDLPREFLGVVSDLQLCNTSTLEKYASVLREICPSQNSWMHEVQISQQKRPTQGVFGRSVRPINDYSELLGELSQMSFKYNIFCII